MLGLTYPYSGQFFLEALRKHIEQPPPHQHTLINTQLNYYCQRFPHINSQLAELIENCPSLQSQDFPSLERHLLNAEKKKAVVHLARFGEGWQLGNNLHRVEQVIGELEAGAKGVSLLPEPHTTTALYLDCLLTLAVAVEKHDPLMTHYPPLKEIVLSLAALPETRGIFFDELLAALNSHQHITYSSLKFVRWELAAMVLSEEDCLMQLFREALKTESSL